MIRRGMARVMMEDAVFFGIRVKMKVRARIGIGGVKRRRRRRGMFGPAVLMVRR